MNKSLSYQSYVISLLLVIITLSAQTQYAQYWCNVVEGDTLESPPIPMRSGLAIDKGILNESLELRRLFAVAPAVFYMQEGWGTENSTARWENFPNTLIFEGSNPVCCPDGTVLIGINLINGEWARTGGTGLSIPAILAHEFGHIMQDKYRSPLIGKQRELHADYMAGWYIGHRLRFIPTNVYQAMKNFYFKGSPNGNHGSGLERESAFAAGFNLNICCNVSSAFVAYQAGEKYVLSQ